MKRSEHYRRTHCSVAGHGTSCLVARETNASAKARTKRDRRVADRIFAQLPAVLCGIALLVYTGCASLQSFADKAQDVRKEVTDTLFAAQGMLEACEELEAPKPRVCEEAAELEALLLSYPGVKALQ